MRLVYNSNSTMHLPALMQISVAKKTGWDGIFVRDEHLRRYLAQGYPPASLRDALAGLNPVNLGALADVERWREPERAAMLREAAALTELALDIGASYVQLLTGPVAPGGAYVGPADLSTAELRRVTASAIQSVADLGASSGLRYYLEPVAWTPLSSLGQAVDVIDAAERENVGLVLDFWHLWQRGATPEDIAGLDARVIFGVDFADSLGPPGTGTPDQRSRCVWPGDGDIPLREWIDAVRSTGFDGWWDNELYSPPHWELADPFAVGAGLHDVLEKLLRD
ncbi:MAG TPA: sugar phosphate isomerase/epimerase family protein [Candidatus Dormibacteraeota bacterium]|nr:sugar phosphate isomerase/epimerase family protein [Candidatus Dormibacteraeota bacterium]